MKISVARHGTQILDTHVEACQTRRVGSTRVSRSLEEEGLDFEDALEGEKVEGAMLDAYDEEESCDVSSVSQLCTVHSS